MNNLDSYSDTDLIKKIKHGDDEDCLNELIVRHTGLCFSVSKKYFSNSSYSGTHSIDFSSEKDGIIYEAAKEFDFKRGVKFCTFLGQKIRWYCLRRLNDNPKSIACEDELLEFLINKNNKNKSHKDIVDSILYILDQLKDKRIKKIFELRYFSDNKKKSSWVRIGKEIGISYQTALNLHNQTISFIKEKLTSKNNCDFI